jgi:hypothetical protein
MYKETPAYQLLILLHSWLQWVVLLTGVVTLAVIARRNRAADPLAKRCALAFLAASLAQMATGFFLYFFITPWVSLLVSFPKEVMSRHGMRFFSLEHTIVTLAALVMVHFGRVATAEERPRNALLWFAGAVVLVVVSIAWPVIRFDRPLLRL